MSSLDHCPPELCQRIFQFACTDDGTTGRSLSLVSKYIRDTSLPYKLQSILIAGADQAISFAVYLTQTIPQHRRVLYLFISNDKAVQPILESSSPPSNSSIIRAVTKAAEVLPGVKWRKKYRLLKKNVDLNAQCMQTNRRRDESIFAASLEIIHLTANTLRAVNINFDSSWKFIPAHLGARTPVSQIRSMPALTSMTVAYYALFHSEVDESLFLEEEARDGGDKALSPMLRYLDLAGCRSPPQPSNVYGRIARLAPGLRYLRLPMRMADNLEGALGLGPGLSSMEDEHVPVEADAESGSETDTIVHEYSTPKAHTDNLPSTLQRVYIQLSAPDPHACCCGSWRHHVQEQGRYSLAVEQFKDLERRDGRVVVLDVEDAKMDFEEIVSRGRDGVKTGGYQ